ncbi:MAG: PAS domain S-box protein [Gammaproteobacteria bacterium]|nr:PAS domain S-box protein [Gammaproteobacteria bacterium]
MNKPPHTEPADLDALAPEVFRRLTETSADGIGIARLDSHLLYANASLRRLFGLTDPATLHEQRFFDHYPPAEAERLRYEILPQVLATGAWVGPLGLMPKSGASRTFIQSLSLLRSAHGAAVGYTTVITDLSERAATEAKLAGYREYLEQQMQARTQALEQQSQRNRMIVNAAFDGFFAADLKGRLCDCNHAYCEMLGYSREELLQLSVTDIEANEQPAEVAAHIQKVIKTGTDRFDTRHRRKDGSLIEVNINVSLETVGEAAQFFAFVHDITPRKQVEAEILRRRDEAEHANAAKSDFLSRMSHELRTPLNAILGFGELLETDPESPLSATQLDNVREIRQAGDHLLALVNEVLDLSRVESGQLQICLQAVAITPMIESCLAQLQPQAMQRGLRMTALPLDTPCAVQADPTRLREVLFNLLTNAIKYNRPGGDIQVSCTLEPILAPTVGPALSSTARSGPAGEQRLRICVRDSGRGIPAEALPRLFRPFERLESAYEGIEGAGVGLALSKQLVETMQGRIGVDSVPGEGSNFWFELPMADAAPAAPAVDPAQLTPPRDGQRRVLCIEDNAANLRLIRKIVAPRTDLELLAATSAEAGLEIAVTQRPALILLDINLPGMDGFAALRRLRENPATRDIPVVAVTANAMTTDIERGRAAGFADYLTKPLDLMAFNAVLDRLLG